MGTALFKDEMKENRVREQYSLIFETIAQKVTDLTRVVFMHELFDYEIYGTRVVCNPRGYASYEFTNNFSADFVLEI